MSECCVLCRLPIEWSCNQCFLEDSIRIVIEIPPCPYTYDPYYGPCHVHCLRTYLQWTLTMWIV